MIGVAIIAGLLGLLLGFVVGLDRGSDIDGSLRKQVATLRHEADESHDYANRLLEDPAFYASEYTAIQEVACPPVFGVYGRLHEPHPARPKGETL
jgi:hypothetical protein